MGEAKRKRKSPLPGDAKGTYADKLTLDELAANDLEMVKDAIKNANRYHFGQDMRRALIFIRTCMDVTLKKLGINVNPPASKAQQAEYAKVLDKLLAEKQVRIEHRNRYKGDDTWRCGLYIYQRDELVAFVSDVLTNRRTEFNRETLKIEREDIGYMVVTNADLSEAKRIFLMPTMEKPAPIEPLPPAPVSRIVDSLGNPLQLDN